MYTIYICAPSGSLLQAHVPSHLAYDNCLRASMVNFSDPGTIARDSRAYTFAAMLSSFERSRSPPLLVVLDKLSHTVGGLYM